MGKERGQCIRLILCLFNLLIYHLWDMILSPLQNKVTENHSILTALKDHKWNVLRRSQPSWYWTGAVISEDTQLWSFFSILTKTDSFITARGISYYTGGKMIEIHAKATQDSSLSKNITCSLVIYKKLGKYFPYWCWYEKGRRIQCKSKTFDCFLTF